jgi:hypothetical protein
VTDDDTLDEYFDPLTNTDRAQLEERLARYRERLDAEGYEATIAEGDGGFFAGVLVIDDERGRVGFLEADGSVSWLTGDLGGVGALGSAVVQNPGDELDSDAGSGLDDSEHVDVE